MTIEQDNQRDIIEIKEALIKHYADDEKSFASINSKLDSIHDKIDRNKDDRDDSHTLIHKDYDSLRSDIKELSDKVTPVIRWLDNATYSKTILLWFLGVVGTLIGIAIGIKELLKK